MMRYPWTKLILIALCAAGSLAAQDEGGPEAAKNPDPQIAKEIDDFKTAVSDKKMAKDLEARAFLGRWVSAFETMHQKDKSAVVKVLDDVFSRAKPRPPETQELYEASAVALSRMEKPGAEVLKKAFNNARFRKTEWVSLRARLIGSLGAAKDPAHLSFILDIALRDPEDQIIAAAGQALGNYEKAELNVRRDVVKKLVKRFNEIHDASRSDSLDDPVAQTKQRTYAAISDPWNTSLGKLTGQAFRTPQDWQRWWNKSKDENWDEGKGS